MFRRKPPKQTPEELGYIVAGGLHYACNRFELVGLQQDLISDVTLSREAFLLEVWSLAGFSADWGLFRLHLAGVPSIDSVRQGYQRGWRDFSAQKLGNRLIVEAFVARVQSYINFASNRSDDPVEPVTYRFANLLGLAIGIDAENLPLLDPSAFEKLPLADQALHSKMGLVRMLAQATAPTIFDTYAGLPQKVLADAGMVRS